MTRKLKLSGDPSEAIVLRAVLDLLRYHPLVAWAERMNVGKGFLSPTRSGENARWIEFGFVGCSDILGQMRNGRLLAVEVKKVGGIVKPLQRHFLEEVKANGGIAGVVRSVDEALALVTCETLPLITFK